MSDLRGKGTLAPKFQSKFCTSLKNDIRLGQESIIGESSIATLLYVMIGDYSAGMFLYPTYSRRFMTLGRDTSHIGYATA